VPKEVGLEFKKINKSSFWLGAVAHICNPSYLGSGDWEDLGFKGSPGRKLARLHFNQKIRHGGACLWSHLHRGRTQVGKTKSEASSRQKHETLLKK
jgi:hypothetical protein